MNFIKIKDPTKRYETINQYIALKNSIQQRDCNERLGDLSQQRELTKLYKPITESQSSAAKDIAKEITTMKESTDLALKALPASLSTQLKAILPAENPFAIYPSIEENPEKVLDTKDLRNPSEVDTMFGIHSDNNGVFRIGKNPEQIEFLENEIEIGGIPYKRTQGLYSLLTDKTPTGFDESDYMDYANILKQTSVMEQPDEPNKPLATGTKTEKWKTIVAPIWQAKKYNVDPWRVYLLAKSGIESSKAAKNLLKENKAADKFLNVSDSPNKPPQSPEPSPQPVAPPKVTKKKLGKGIEKVVIPGDVNALVEMLPVRIAALKAGNTGVRNEIIVILDELLRQGYIDRNSYTLVMNDISASI